jgi:hypothetical protein
MNTKACEVCIIQREDLESVCTPVEYTLHILYFKTSGTTDCYSGGVLTPPFPFIYTAHCKFPGAYTYDATLCAAVRT